jgi:hypothetical protein
MKYEKAFLVLVFFLVTGVWAIVLQNFGFIPPISKPRVNVDNTVDIRGSVDVDNTVDIRGSVDVDNTVDINVAEVVGYGLVCSKLGMHIGVNSTSNTIIPINWGEVSIGR